MLINMEQKSYIPSWDDRTNMVNEYIGFAVAAVESRGIPFLHLPFKSKSLSRYVVLVLCISAYL